MKPTAPRSRQDDPRDILRGVVRALARAAAVEEHSRQKVAAKADTDQPKEKADACGRSDND